MRFSLACLTVAISIFAASPRGDQSAPAPGALTIDRLVDIKHPSNPIWSRDSTRIAFQWERAGVANLYIVPADASTKPAAVTTDGQPVNGAFWSADNKLYFTRGGTLMLASLDGRAAPRPAFPQLSGRNYVVSRDGTRVVYLSGGGGRGSGDREPVEIRLRSLADGVEKTIASADGPITALAWIDDQRLTYTVGAGGQLIRHEQTPEYPGR